MNIGETISNNDLDASAASHY